MHPAHAESFFAGRSSAEDVPDPGGSAGRVAPLRQVENWRLLWLAGFDLRPGFLCGARSDLCSDRELCLFGSTS